MNKNAINKKIRQRMFFFLFLFALLSPFKINDLLFGSASAQTQAEFIVEQVTVSGNQRVETEAILRLVSISEGDTLDYQRIGNDIRSVYSLGFFRDIQVDAIHGENGVILTFIVEEKPAIDQVVFFGNEAQDDDDLQELVTIRVGGVLDEAAVIETEQAILARYREEGYHLVEIDTEIIPSNDSEVIVSYQIHEYAKIRVGRVTFVGNEALTDQELISVMRTRPNSFLSIVNSFGDFDASHLEADLQNLRVFYYDSGFLDTTISQPMIEMSRTRNEVYITVVISEGEPYVVSSVGISGDLLDSPEETMEMVSLQPEHVFRSSLIRTDIDTLTNHYRDQGYANANVNMLHRLDQEALRIDVEYDIQLGELAYIDRIDIVGNSMTRDRVVRRELAIEEGDLYSSTAIRRSEMYIQRLGFFENIVIQERPSLIDPNLIDLEVHVTERPTRSFQVGFGYSSAESFVGTAQISENNLLGRGQTISFNLSTSKLRNLYQISFIEPRLFDSDWQLSMNASNSRILYPSYERQSRGIDFSVGYHITRQLTTTFGYQLEEVSANAGGYSGGNTVIHSRLNGGVTSSFTTGLYHDTRNDRYFPSSGTYNSLSLELADDTWFSENQFFRTRSSSRLYFEPFLPGWTVRANAEVGYVASTDESSEVPIFERFYVGGPNSVRGFQRLSLSPSDPTGAGNDPWTSTREFLIGGNKELTFNLELEFPIIQVVGIRGVVFVDAGNAFKPDEPFSLQLDLFDDEAHGEYGNVLRTAYGLGFRWTSPIGQLRFEWGFPMNPLPNEKPMVFEFSIGNSF